MLLPLRGVRVLEFARSVSAAFGSEILARLGAEVIKVREGTSFESMLPYEVEMVPDRRVRSALLAYLDRDKRVVTIDASSGRGRGLVRRLAEHCDVMMWSPSAHPGSSDAFGPAADDWLLRPVTVAVSATGVAEPRADGGESTFVAQHASGFAYHQASPVRDPETTPPVGGADWEIDLLVGVVAAMAALSGMRGAKGSRPGPVLDVATSDVLTYLLVDPFADWLADRFPGHRNLASDEVITIAGGLVWLLPCADGHVMVSPREDHQWRRWSAVMGNPSWASEPTTCGSREARQANALWLHQRMASWSIGHTKAHVFARAQEKRVACFPISRPNDLLNNDQLAARRFFAALAVDDATIQIPGLPFQMTTAGGEALEKGEVARAPDRADIGDDLLSVWLDETVQWVKSQRELAMPG